MDPYVGPGERRTGANRPKIAHLPSHLDPRTSSDRQAEKQRVAAERRGIKKSARRHLARELQRELTDPAHDA